MSRAVRRQQQSAGGKDGSPRLTGLRQQTRTSRGARPPTPTRKRFSIPRPRFLEEIWAELKKVTWPTREETMYLTMVVIVVSLVVGAMLGGVDIFFNWLLGHLLLK
jgi:preprotein translocase subunit SecE